MKFFFIDRDGVINKEIGYLHKIEDFHFINGVIDALKYIAEKDYKIVIITNQSGIGRGLYSEDDLIKLNLWMTKSLAKEGIELMGILYCPHSPEDDCHCRKPKPGLFIEAKTKFNIDMNKSWSVGDKETDIIAARSSGIENTILVRSGHKIDERNTMAKYVIDSLSNIYDLKI